MEHVKETCSPQLSVSATSNASSISWRVDSYYVRVKGVCAGTADRRFRKNKTVPALSCVTLKMVVLFFFSRQAGPRNGNSQGGDGPWWHEWA